MRYARSIGDPLRVIVLLARDSLAPHLGVVAQVRALAGFGA